MLYNIIITILELFFLQNIFTHLSFLHPPDNCFKYSLLNSSGEYAIIYKELGTQLRNNEKWNSKSQETMTILIIKGDETAVTNHSIKSSLLRTPLNNMAEEAAPVVAEPYLPQGINYL